MLKWIAGFALLLLAACGGGETPSKMCTGLDPVFVTPQDRLARSAATETPEAAVASAVQRVFAPVGPAAFRRGRSARTYLALSTGGQWAAFGAGVLAGWSQNRAFPRPDFDIVTGASAGATVAPAAFAGRAFDAQLPFAGDTDAESLARQRFLLSLLFSNSVYDVGGLERLAGETAAELLEPIGRAENENRALLVGAVNLDTTGFEVFDLAAYAARPEARADCLSETVLASAAIPALFPPRVINDARYADAGLRNHVFFNGIEDGRNRVGAADPVDAYVIVNGRLAPTQGRVAENLVDLSLRSFSIVTDQGLRSSLADAAAIAEDRDWTVRVLIGDTIDLEGPCGALAETKGVFDNCVVRELYAQGEALGRTMGEDRWLTGDALQDRLKKLRGG